MISPAPLAVLNQDLINSVAEFTCNADSVRFKTALGDGTSRWFTLRWLLSRPDRVMLGDSDIVLQAVGDPPLDYKSLVGVPDLHPVGMSLLQDDLTDSIERAIYGGRTDHLNILLPIWRHRDPGDGEVCHNRP